MRLIELNGFVRGNYLDCGACEWFRKRLGSLLKARLRTIKRERGHIWLLPMLIIERIPTAHYEEEKVKIQERCSHTMINLAIMWDGKLFQWFASETIFIWFATFDCKPFQSKLGTKYERFNVFPIFFVSLFWCSFHFSQPCSLQFSLPIVFLFPALWQSLVDNVRGRLPRQSIGDCWTSGAKPGPSAAKIAPGHWFQTHTHSTLLPLLSSSYTWPSQNGDSL